MLRHWICLLSLIGLSACGGGGGGGGGGSSGWIPGEFLPAASFAAQCVAPRRNIIDPATGLPYPDIGGSTTDQNNWLRSWSNDLYLWYNEITDVDPAGISTPDYFELMKTFATTSSGNPKDKFHFSIPTDEWLDFSQSGLVAGYGAEWAIVRELPPRQVVVAFTQPNSPATSPSANLSRGAEVLEVDGVDLVNSNSDAAIDALNAGLFPAAQGETHTFRIRDLGAATTRNITLQSTLVTLDPVQNTSVIPTATGDVGYLLFLDHIETAEEELVDAIDQLATAGVSDLVLDIRYNGGGFLAIASQLAYMVAGPVPTAGQTFEEIRFNDKHPITNPVTGQNLSPTPFFDETLGFSVSPGQNLPTLNLSRVFVLTGPDTCSASESIMNGLRGVNVEVIQIGSTTCGKPYGFYATDNCGTTYFSIQFQGVNAQGFGDYSDGFTPANATGPTGTPVTGCSVADDFGSALGDPGEGRLATALAYRESQNCPAPSGAVAAVAAGATDRDAGLPLTADRPDRSLWRRNRILTR